MTKNRLESQYSSARGSLDTTIPLTTVRQTRHKKVAGNKTTFKLGSVGRGHHSVTGSMIPIEKNAIGGIEVKVKQTLGTSKGSIA